MATKRRAAAARHRVAYRDRRRHGPMAVCHCGAPLVYVVTADRCPDCNRIRCALCRAPARRGQCPPLVGSSTQGFPRQGSTRGGGGIEIFTTAAAIDPF